MTERIDEKDLPQVTAAPTDELRALRAGKSVRVPIGSLPVSPAVQAQINALAAGQAAGQKVYRTWSELSGVTGSAGVGAQVIDDAGTHTDPVVGGTVANAGQYVWSASPAGWRWVRPDALPLKADKSELAILETSIYDDMDVNVFNVAASKNLYDPATRQADKFINSSTGAINNNAGWACTGFIPVEAGKKYTVSAPATRRQGIAFYSSTDSLGGGYISGSYNGSTELVVTVTAPAGAQYMVVNLQSDTIPEPAWVQVEEGDVATPYIPYGVTMRSVKPEAVDGLADVFDKTVPQVDELVGQMTVVVQNVGRPVDSAVSTGGGSVLSVDMVFEYETQVDCTVSEIRYYSSNATQKYLEVYTLSGGTFTRIASYQLPVPVVGDNHHTAADLPTIQIPAGSYIGFRGGLGMAFAQSTAADGAGWYIGSGANQSSFAKGPLRTNSRMSAGVKLTAIQSMQPIVDAISSIGNRGKGLTLGLSGGSIAITDELNGLPLVHNVSLAGSSNGSFRFDSTVYNSEYVASVNDDITPLRGLDAGTVGANHGYVNGIYLAPNPDGKTVADLGSTWEDTNGREYVLVAVTSHATTPLQFMGNYGTGVSGNVTVSSSLPPSDLTHKSGATHTGSVAKAGIVAASAASATTQLLPAIGRKALTVSADNAILSGDGQYTASAVVIAESYEVLDYASIYETAKANVGTSFADLIDSDITGAVLVMNRYTYRPGGRLNIVTTYDELRPFRLGLCGFVQAMPLNISGYTLTRYVPGMGAVGGHDWSAGVDYTSWSTTVDLPASSLNVSGQVSAFHLDVLSSGGTPYLGFAMGYLPFGARADSASRGSQRVVKVPSALWNMRSTKKCYPAVTASEAVGWGHLQVEAYRVFLSPDQVEAVLARKESAYGAWAALDSVAQVSA